MKLEKYYNLQQFLFQKSNFLSQKGPDLPIWIGQNCFLEIANIIL